MPLATIPDMLQRRKELEQHLQLLLYRSCQWGRAERERGAATIENLIQQLVEISEHIDAAALDEAHQPPDPPASAVRTV